MPFGKFRGIELSSVPTWYLQWLTELDDLRDPLASAVRDEVARRGAGHATPVRGDENLDSEIVDELIGAGLRALAKKYHPDAGGSHQHMLQVNLAAEWLRRAARELAQ